jgi:hypothetical protein
MPTNSQRSQRPWNSHDKPCPRAPALEVVPKSCFSLGPEEDRVFLAELAQHAKEFLSAQGMQESRRS